MENSEKQIPNNNEQIITPEAPAQKLDPSIAGLSEKATPEEIAKRKEDLNKLINRIKSL